MGENFRGEFYSYADIHAVGFGGDLQLVADTLHPFATATTNGNNTVLAGKLAFFRENGLSVFHCAHTCYGGVEIEVDMFLQLVVDVFQNDIVDIRAEVAYGRVK